MRPCIKRVCLIGAESTGKTTLAKILANHYHTVWVPEYAREYLQDREGKRTSIEIMLPIAIGQSASEECKAEFADNLLICDTNILSTAIWSEHYFGRTDDVILEMLKHERCDLYLLLDVDVPWVDDGIRDSLNHRELIHKRFLQELRLRKLPFVIVSGTFEARVDLAIQSINSLLSN